MDAPTDSPTTPPPPPERTGTLPRAVAWLARRIDPEVIGTGGVARLRRLDPDAPAAPEYWRLLAELAGGAAGRGSERGWALVMAGMARMAPQAHQGGHDFAPGRVLALAGFPETRLLRLLRAEPHSPTFDRAVRAAVGWLAAGARPVDWTRLAALLLTREPGRAEDIRRRIARDYYAALDSAPRDGAS